MKRREKGSSNLLDLSNLPKSIFRVLACDLDLNRAQEVCIAKLSWCGPTCHHPYLTHLISAQSLPQGALTSCQNWVKSPTKRQASLWLVPIFSFPSMEILISWCPLFQCLRARGWGTGVFHSFQEAGYNHNTQWRVSVEHATGSNTSSRNGLHPLHPLSMDQKVCCLWEWGTSSCLPASCGLCLHGPCTEGWQKALFWRLGIESWTGYLGEDQLHRYSPCLCLLTEASFWKLHFIHLTSMLSRVPSFYKPPPCWLNHGNLKLL